MAFFSRNICNQTWWRRIFAPACRHSATRCTLWHSSESVLATCRAVKDARRRTRRRTFRRSTGQTDTDHRTDAIPLAAAHRLFVWCSDHRSKRLHGIALQSSWGIPSQSYEASDRMIRDWPYSYRGCLCDGGSRSDERTSQSLSTSLIENITISCIASGDVDVAFAPFW